MRKKSNWDIEHITFNNEMVVKKPKGLKKHLKRILIVVLVIYLFFIFYGYVITRFYKNSDGNI